MKTFIEEGQNLFDLAIQCYGSAESAFKLVEENGWDNLNVDLRAGWEVVYSELPAPEVSVNLPKTKDIQEFYIFRQIRVRTGEELYQPEVICPIPEGYVMFQFRIIEIGRNQCLYFDFLNEGCPDGDFGRRAESVLALVNATIANPTEAAMLTAAWINNGYFGTQGLYATSTQNMVTIYIPISFLPVEKPCGWVIHLCAYNQYGRHTNEKPASFYPANENPPKIQYNTGNGEFGTTVCCNREGSADDIFQQDNSWMTE
jgi:hypothetical protein